MPQARPQTSPRPCHRHSHPRRVCARSSSLKQLVKPSSYQDNSWSSKVSKGLVGALTSVVNLAASQPRLVAPPNVDREPIAPTDVLDGVRSDFTDSCYLWTGNISDDIYDEQCVFTDPTLSFQGLSTFKRNLASLKPLIDRLVMDPRVELKSCELQQGASCVVASWRMTGQFKLPWRPVLDLEGRTTFTYSAAAGNRVVRYDEGWGISAAEALMQLLRPGPP